jgi:molecular chaperone HscB
LNPFEVLGLPPRFALTAAELEQRQRELNRALHPDRHATKTPAERRRALSIAMDINQACRTLSDPAARADALLALLGVEIHSAQTVTDPALLMDMLEQREHLEELRKSGDHNGLMDLRRNMTERETEVLGKLGECFEALLLSRGQGDAGRSAAERSAGLARAQQLLAELRYVRRLTEEASAILDEA